LSTRPQDPKAFAALEAAYRKSNRWDELVRLYEEKGDHLGMAQAIERHAGAAGDARNAAALYLRLGEIWEEKLGRRDRAAIYFQRACRLDPQNAEARARAFDNALALRRFAQSKSILDQSRAAGSGRKAGAPKPKALAEQYARLGTALIEEPIDHAIALEALTEALALSPDAPGAAAALEQLRATPKRWKEEARQLRSQAIEARDRKVAARLYLRIAGLHAAYDPDAKSKIQENLDRLLLLWPGMPQALDFMERYYGDREDWRGYSDALAAVAASTRDRAAAVGLQLRIGTIDLVRFGDRALARIAFEKALELDPTSESAALETFEMNVDEGRHAEAWQVLERHFGAVPAKPEHVPLRLQAAQIALRGGDSEGARRHLEAALRLEPDSPAVAAALTPIYAGTNDPRKQVEVLEIQLSAASDPAEQVRLLEQLAELEAEKLQAPKDALRHLGQALAIEPARAKLRKAMEQIAGQGEGRRDLARAYAHAAEQVADPKLKGQLLRRLAEIYDRELDRPAEAVVVYRALTELEPGDRALSTALEDALGRAGAHAELASALEGQLARAKGEERRALAARLARSRQDAGDPRGAAKAWRQALEEQPNDREALKGLAAALEDKGAEPGRKEVESLCETLELLAKTAPAAAERAEYALRRAEILAERLDRPPDAAEAYLAVIDAEGLAPALAVRAATGLERMLARGQERPKVHRALAKAYATIGDHARQATMLEALAELAGDGSEHERARLLLDAATLRETKLADTRGALGAAGAALRACPSHTEARDRCERLAAASGAEGELFEILTAAAARASEAGLERSLRLRAAQVAEERLGKLEDAQRELERCRALVPGDPQVLAALTRLALWAERWREAAELLSARALAAEPAERAALWAERGDVLLSHGEDPAGAAESFREALGTLPAGVAANDPGRIELLQRLAGALDRAGDAPALEKVLEELSGLARDPAEQAKLALRRGRLLQGQLGDRKGALEHFRAALAARPGDAEAVAGLEEMMLDREDPALQLAAAAILRPIYANQKEPRKLIDTLEVEAAQAKDPSGQANALRQIASIYERNLHQSALAFAAIARAARATPTDGEIRSELRRLALEGDAADSCAEVYEELIETVRLEGVVDLWAELGEWQERRLQDKARASQCYDKVLELSPNHVGALEALHRLHRLADRWEDLHGVCCRLADLSGDPTEKVQLWREAAVIAENKLSDPAKAAAAWRRIADTDPKNVEASAALDRIHESQDQPAELVWALERRREQARGEPREWEIVHRLADLKRTRLNDPEGALQLYTDVLRADRAHTGARAGLDALARTAGQNGLIALSTLDTVLKNGGEHARRIDVREGRLNAVDDPEERALLYGEIRAIFERDACQAQMAFIAACRAYLEGGPARVRVEEDLRRLAKATESFEELAEVYEEASAMVSGAEALELRRLAARVRETEVGDPQAAITAWKGVQEIDPDDGEALDALERLYAGQKQARELVEIAARKAARATGPERVKQLLQLGELREGLGDATGAIAAFEEVLKAEPDDVNASQAMSALERLYAREKRWDPLVGLLSARADRLRKEDPVARTELLLGRARVFEEEAIADGPSRALEAFADLLAEDARQPGAIAGLERLLARPETKVAAARQLEDVYRQAGEARKLVEVLELRLERADESERTPLLAEVAALHERLGQKVQAFQARVRQYRDQLARRGDDPRLRADLERLAFEAGTPALFETLAETLQAAIQAGPSKGVDAATELVLRRRLAALYAENLGNLDEAAKYLEEISVAYPDPEILDALVRIYRRQNAMRELASVFRRQAERAPTPEAKKDLYFEIANIMEEHLTDPEGAIEAYRKILAVDPDDPNALRLLGRVLGATERWDELADVLAKEVAQAEKSSKFQSEAVELRYRLGRIRQQRLADLTGALECFKQVLLSVPRHPGAVSALEELTRTGGDAATEAVAVLEPIYLGEGDHAKVVTALEAKAAGLQDPREKAPLLKRVAEIYAGPLDNPDMAFLAAGRAMREDPDDLAVVELAFREAGRAALLEELASLLTENADRAKDSSSKVEYRRRLGRILSSPASADPPRATEEWTRLLDLAPADGEALEQLTELHRQSGDGQALGQVLRRRLSLEEDDEKRAELLIELAKVQEERLKDAPGAISTLRRLLEVKPDHRAALAHLDRLCTRGERWVELAEVLARELAAAETSGDKPAAAQFRGRLAEIKDTRLADKEGALALYHQLVEEKPEHEQAQARLESIFQKDPGNEAAAAALEKAYAATGAWAKYAAVLDRRAAVQPDPESRKGLFLALSQVHEGRLQNQEMAFLALCRAFREDPADPEVRKAMERTAVASSSQEELAAIYEEELDRLVPPASVEVALQLGALNEEHLREPEAAIRFYEKARLLDAAGAPQALLPLERLYRQSEKWNDLADVLNTLVDRQEDPAEKVTLLFRLGQLCEERLEDVGRAAVAYGEIQNIDPKHLPALRALERLFEAGGRTDKLFENLAAQRELAGDAATKERLAARMAQVATELGEADQAITLWNEVLAVRPRHDQALAALETLYEKRERWQDLAQLLRTRISGTLDRREVARLNDKLGWLLGTKLGNADQAIQSFKAALESDPKNRRALEALRDIYAAQGNSEELVGIYRRLIPLQDDATGVKTVRQQLAEVLLQANRKEEAVEQAKRALDLEPHTASDLLRMEEIFRSAGATLDVIRVTEARAEILSSEGNNVDSVAAWFAAADLWRQQMKKRDGAANALEKVLQLEPANRTAYEGLRDIYAQGGNWREFTRVSDLFAPNIVDKKEKLALLRELGDTHERKLGQKEMAFLAYCRAFGEEPTDVQIAATIGRLAEETGAWEELCDVYEQVAEEEAPGPVRIALLLELGKMQDTRLDDPDAAERTFRRVLDADPAHHEALEALASLFSKRGRTKELVVALEHKFEAAAGLEDRKATLMEIARVYDQQLNDTPEAVNALRRLLELDGGDRPAIDRLAEIYRRDQKWNELAGVLGRARDLATDAADRLAFQLQIAEIYEGELADDESAVDAYRAVLAIDDMHVGALTGLERIYTKLDRFAELNRVYEKQVEIAPDPREKIKILVKSASIWEEKIHNATRTIDCYEHILQLDGGNLPAIRSLERLYRSEAQWEKLISVTQHHATLVQDRREQVALHIAVGEVWGKELSRVDRAEAVYSHALEIEPDSREAINSLGKLYERSGNWNLALEMLKREARLAGAGPDAVELYFRMGKINEDMLLDPASAKTCYNRALDLDPGHLPAIRALKVLHELEKDRDAYLESLIAEARYTEDPGEKTRLFYEVGKFYQEERDDRDSATKYYEEALKRTNDYLAAAKPLADIYVAQENWPRAEQMLDIVVKKLAAEGDPKDLCRQSYRLGYVAEKLEKRDKALESYRRAYELDATYLPALEGLGNLLVQHERWEDALRIYQAILIHHRDGLTDLEVVEIYWQIGEIQIKVNQPERAIKSFEKALELDQGHEPSRQSLVKLYEAGGDFESSVEHRQKLLQVLEGEARLAMFLSIGEICRDKLKDPYQAIDAYLGAMRVDAGSLPVMEALLGLYRETRQGQKGADVLAKMLGHPDLDADAPRAAKLHFSLGEILRDEIRDEDAAVEHFNKALDKNPRFADAFKAIEDLLGKRKKWEALEQNYVRMIQRLPKSQDVAQVRLAMWKTLGELYNKALRNPEAAITAYEVVAKGNPDDQEAWETLSDLLANRPGDEEKAIEAFRACLRVSNNPQKAASALVGLHAARKEYDKAYTAAQVLTYLLGVATPEEQQVVAKLKRFARDSASKNMTDRLWTEHLYHEKVRGPLAEILALIYGQAGSLFTQSHRDLGIHPKRDEIDVGSSMLFFVNMYKYIARTLSMEALRLYRVEGRAGGLSLVSTNPVALVAGEEMFKDRPKKELWFSIAKAMAFSRPELIMARLMPHDQLDVVFQAACSLGTSRFVVSGDPGKVEKMRRQLERTLPESSRMPLKQLARRYCDVQQTGDVRAYMDGAELTSNRAGILMCGDIDVAKKAILSEKAQVSKLRDQTKVRDLVLFCLSEEYATLRDQLGLSVVVKV
jgi:tetratricopeptide (TPR) repeat protein